LASFAPLAEKTTSRSDSASWNELPAPLELPACLVIGPDQAAPQSEGLSIGHYPVGRDILRALHLLLC
jgi:hypothetical protein